MTDYERLRKTMGDPLLEYTNHFSVFKYVSGAGKMFGLIHGDITTFYDCIKDMLMDMGNLTYRDGKQPSLFRGYLFELTEENLERMRALILHSYTHKQFSCGISFNIIKKGSLVTIQHADKKEVSDLDIIRTTQKIINKYGNPSSFLIHDPTEHIGDYVVWKKGSEDYNNLPNGVTNEIILMGKLAAKAYDENVGVQLDWNGNIGEETTLQTYSKRGAGRACWRDLPHKKTTNQVARTSIARSSVSTDRHSLPSHRALSPRSGNLRGLSQASENSQPRQVSANSIHDADRSYTREKPEDGKIGAVRRYKDSPAGYQTRVLQRSTKNMTCTFENGHLCGSPEPGGNQDQYTCSLCRCAGHRRELCRCPTCGLTNNHSPSSCPRLDPRWKITLRDNRNHCSCDDEQICYYCRSQAPAYYLVQKAFYNGNSFTTRRMPLYKSQNKALLEKIQMVLRNTCQCVIVDNLNSLIVSDAECLSQEFKDCLFEMDIDATAGLTTALSSGVLSIDIATQILNLINQ